MILYQATTSYFCVGFLVSGYYVVETAPIIKWAEGKNLDYFRSWIYRKGGTVKKVSEE